MLTTKELFAEVIKALDSMEKKELIKGKYKNRRGDVCAIGALLRYKGIKFKPTDTVEHLRHLLGCSRYSFEYVVDLNDGADVDSKEARHKYVRDRLEKELLKEEPVDE